MAALRCVIMIEVIDENNEEPRWTVSVARPGHANSRWNMVEKGIVPNSMMEIGHTITSILDG